jgi:hypothetical protein
MNNIATDRRNALLIENFCHMKIVRLLGKSLTNWDATPFTKSKLKQGHDKADGNRIRKKVKPECPQ